MTTVDVAGEMNVAPMGAVVTTQSFEFFELRPYPTSQTYANLMVKPEGVMHITDDCGLIAKSALGLPLPDLKLQPADKVDGYLISECCRCFEFNVKHANQQGPRGCFICSVTKTHRFRDFIGFNRAAFAVIEAAILATRIDFLPREEISEQLLRLETIVNKTGGEYELTVYRNICEFTERQFANVLKDND